MAGNEEFSAQSQDAQAQIDEQRAAKLEAMVSRIKRIPMLSQMSTEVIREVDNPNISSRRMAEIINTDPVMVAEVLKLANSAYFGVRVRVNTVQQATSLLGVNMVSSLVVSLALMDTKKAYTDIPLFDVNRYWGHCMAASQLCGVIARRLGSPMVGPGEASLAGLLHDIGILILAANEKRNLSQLLETLLRRTQQAQETGADLPHLVQIEEEIFGFNHADVGAWLGNKWNLPASIVETIRFHNSLVDDCSNRELVAVTQLADFLCNRNGMDFVAVKAEQEPAPETLQVLARSGQSDFQENLRKSIQPELERAKHYFEAFSSGVTDKEAEEPQATEVEQRRPVETSLVETRKARSRPKADQDALPSPSMWTALVPGLYQMLDDQILLGVAFLVLFLLGGGLAFGFGVAGQAIPALLGVGLSFISWLFSLVLAWMG